MPLHAIKTTRSILLICLTALMATVFVRYQLIDLFEYRIWGDRALSRAFFSVDGLPPMAAELNFSGRVPGSALYALLAGLQSINHSPLLPYVLQVLFDMVAIGVVLLGTRRYSGLTVAAVAAAMYALSIPVLQHLSELWNPGFIMLPTVLMLFCTVRVGLERRYGYLIPFFLIGGVTAQVHLSIYPFIFANLATMFIFTWSSFNLRYLGFLVLGIAILFLSQWNYWLFEIANDFPNTSLIFSNPTDYSRGWSAVITNVYTLVRTLSFLQNPFLGGTGGIAAFAGHLVLDLIVFVAFFNAAAFIVSKGFRENTPLDAPEPVWKFLAIVSLVGGLTVAIVSATALNAHFRYVLSAVAPASIFIGVGLGALALRLDASNHGRGAGLALTVLFAIAIATQAIDYHRHLPKRDLHTYSTLRDILGTVRDEFGLAGKAFRDRVSFTHRIRDGKIISFPPQTTFTYATEVLFPPLTDAGDADFCLLVTTPDGLAALAAKTGKPQIAVSDFNDAVAVDSVLSRDDFTVIKYRTASGNCLKNTENPYIYLGPVASISDNWDKAGSSGFLNEKALNVGHQFVFRGSLQGMFGGAVKLIQNGDMIRATLASSNLRDDGSRVCPPGEWRPNGVAFFDVWSFMARDPKILFVETSTGAETELTLYRGVLGERMSGRLTPWSAEVKRPDGALFDIYFAADLRFKCAKEFDPVKILLTKDHAFDPT
jgi:hypothetical protein